ncbi:PAS domain S-box protein [Pedobacter sp. P351]|uniref:PAS domain S-box protein n=1 Tax=Pedobacter superstes TaxID=3133441 RepID=UPI00309B96A8
MLASENIFRNIVEISPFPVYVCTGEDMIITVANDATLKAWGRDKSVIGQSFSEALPELHDQPFADLIREVYTSGETYYTNNDRADLVVDGVLQTFYFKFTYQALRDEENNITSVLCFASDVTELERARQTIEKSRQTLYNMVRQAPVGICIINVNGLVVEVANESYLELVGRKRTELENRPIWDAVPEAADSYAPVLNNVINTGSPFYAKEHELMLFRNGVKEMVFIDFVYEPVTDIDGNISSVMVIGIDVTDKVNARRDIEDAEERARLAIEAAEMGTFDLDMVNNYMVTSDRFNNIFGVESSGVTRETLIQLIHPDDQAVRQAAHDEAIKSGKLFYEARLFWKDSSVRWIRVQGKAYFDNNGLPFRILGTVLDITEYKRLQQQKDDFISVASHELKTPMTSIKASMQLLGRLINTDPASQKVSMFMDKVNSNLLKMQQLVESLLNVSKITAGQLALNKTTFTLSEMIHDCCDHIRMNGKYELKIEGDMELKVFADKYKIDQVVANLINNVVKYASDSEKIVFHVKEEGGTAKVSVQDFGQGIPASKLEHLFERYYRVDSSGFQYSGLGLGLYISADIIHRHNGKIGVVSEEGKGSIFWFTLPLSESA